MSRTNDRSGAAKLRRRPTVCVTLALMWLVGVVGASPVAAHGAGVPEASGDAVTDTQHGTDGLIDPTDDEFAEALFDLDEDPDSAGHREQTETTQRDVIALDAPAPEQLRPGRVFWAHAARGPPLPHA